MNKVLELEKLTGIDSVRYESFGGILSSQNPPFLAWVDREFMKEAGYPHSPLWDKKKGTNYLSSPVEVHLSVTDRCSQTCSGCYMNSGNANSDLPLNDIKNTLKRLKNMGVFHVALGGGEAFEREDFGAIVSYCREIGLVPNLTTNGLNIGKKEVEICKNMGQVNISLDGIEDNYTINGRAGDFNIVEKAIELLVASGLKTGINTVISSKNYHLIKEIVSYANKKGLNEIEFLKYKPTGRGKKQYKNFALDQNMIRNFYPLIVRLSEKQNVELKIDCSFIPAMVFHSPPKDALEKLAVTGCEGGNYLLGVKSNGDFSACSFIDNNEPISKINTLWNNSTHLKHFREWTDQAPKPCASCHYLEICRGGCRAVSLHLSNDINAPDPECPIVFDYQKENGFDK